MKGKNIFAGIVLILFAVALFVDKMGIYPDMPMLKIGISAVLVCVMATSLRKLEFLGITFPLGLIACMFSRELHIDQVSPMIIIIVSVLVGIGLTMIFGKSKMHVINVNSEKTHDNDAVDGRASGEYSEGDGCFSLENSFGSRTQYVSVKNMKKGHIENGFGSLTVYLNGTEVDANGAEIHTENGFGELSVYIPKEMRVSIDTENGFGKVNTHGSCATDGNLPVLKLFVENGMGSTDIYFE